MVAAAPLLLLIFLLSCFTLPCYSLTVYYTNSSTTPPSFLTLTIPSVYATVGALPTTSARLSLITMQHETCHFMIDMTGYAYVYTGSLLKDLFADCNTMDTASGVTVAKLAQDAGASVVILGAFYKVYLSVGFVCVNVLCFCFVSVCYTTHRTDTQRFHDLTYITSYIATHHTQEHARTRKELRSSAQHTHTRRISSYLFLYLIHLLSLKTGGLLDSQNISLFL